MAASCSEVEHVLEKVASLPTNVEYVLTRYSVKAGKAFETHVEAISAYEAALKASFSLLELGVLSDINATLVEVTDHSNLFTKKANLPQPCLQAQPFLCG